MAAWTTGKARTPRTIPKSTASWAKRGPASRMKRQHGLVTATGMFCLFRSIYHSIQFESSHISLVSCWEKTQRLQCECRHCHIIFNQQWLCIWFSACTRLYHWLSKRSILTQKRVKMFLLLSNEVKIGIRLELAKFITKSEFYTPIFTTTTRKIPETNLTTLTFS